MAEKKAPVRRRKAKPAEAPKEAPEVETPAEAEVRKKEAKEPEEAPAAPEGYRPKQKPKLSDAQRRALALRRRLASRRPRFLRSEWFRHPRLGEVWRKPRGDHNKIRSHQKYRINVPSIGYRGPRSVRGLHPSGFVEILVHNPRQLEGLDPAVHAVRIGSGVGLRKRALLEAAAEQKGLRILNRSVGA